MLGEHAGCWYYTLGQREGLQLGGVRGRPAAPWYVVGKDVARNIVYVDQGADGRFLMSRALHTEAAHWIAGAPPAAAFACTAKTRYRQPDQACSVSRDADGAYRVVFEQLQRAVTPGQSVVFYQNEVCLGGGVIEETFKA